jgi:hypothetical protein
MFEAIGASRKVADLKRNAREAPMTMDGGAHPNTGCAAQKARCPRNGKGFPKPRIVIAVSSR